MKFFCRLMNCSALVQLMMAACGVEYAQVYVGII